jgi:uncharacterized membrane protein YphA (DoxX/SURF4 family)|tara:strand:+ start:128 stop:484 length:357 start_codon:yes stop_codon:yes gene_type:complete
MGNIQKTAMQVNWILLGLVMLIPGLLKLFVMKPAAVVTMLESMPILGSAPTFFAWVLILSEIIFGILILAKYKLRYTTIPPIIILLVAAFTVHWGSWPNVLVHLAVASNYWIWGLKDK